ncbi:MAG TPA: hypothetical protein ENN13_04030 [Candidatus Altiarchaeales archaeon]|nr:hypothetical protein [Candidatus Altiarchaeales archaeon]
MKKYDAYVSDTSDKTLSLAKELGWDGIVAVNAYGKDFKSFAEKTRKISQDIEVLTAAVIEREPGRDAKHALELADLVYVRSSDPETYRKACELWTVDALVAPELNSKNDLMNHREGGLDNVVLKMMAERGMKYITLFEPLLNARPTDRVKIIGRISQNLSLCGKYGVDAILASGAKNQWDLRSTKDFEELTCIFQKPRDIGVRMVAKNPGKLIQKIIDRENPNLLTKGLKVLDWAGAKPSGKKKNGWY